MPLCAAPLSSLTKPQLLSHSRKSQRKLPRGCRLSWMSGCSTCKALCKFNQCPPLSLSQWPKALAHSLPPQSTVSLTALHLMRTLKWMRRHLDHMRLQQQQHQRLCQEVQQPAQGHFLPEMNRGKTELLKCPLRPSPQPQLALLNPLPLIPGILPSLVPETLLPLIGKEKRSGKVWIQKTPKAQAGAGFNSKLVQNQTCSWFTSSVGTQL